MIKNEIVEGICENYTHDGQGVVKVDGYPIFVKGVLRNEVVKVQIMRDRKTYAFGRIVEIIKASAHRQTAPCPIYGRCGGCQLQHMDSEAQRDFKRSKVQEVISRVGKLDIEVNPVMEMEYPFSYRNKGQIPVACVQKQIQTGFYRIHSNDIVDMNACMIQSDVINLLMKTIKDDLQQFNNGSSIRHLLIKHAFTTGEAMVVFISRKKEIPRLDQIVKHLIQVYPKLRSVVVNLNRRDDNVILGNEEMVVYGDGFIVDELNGLKFHISSKSFYQVNPIQTKVLYELALQSAQLSKKEEVLDLYCGVGTISLFMAPHAKHVTGIEIVPSAIRDAKRNAQMNQIENVDFVCSDAAEYAELLVKENRQIDVIVIDPPRKGCEEATLQAMVTINPKRIVYVSCDPATLARDLKFLQAAGYETQKIQPVDMFPQTHHVECVCLLTRKAK